MIPTSNPLTHPASERFSPAVRGSGFINAAYMTPKPLSELEALHRCVERYARPDFGLDDFFGVPEKVRELLAALVGGNAADFSLTGSASFGLATLAWNLRENPGPIVGKRRTILGIDGQFPSNVQVWRRLESAGFTFQMVEGGAGATNRLLESIDGGTALVAVAPLSWTDGSRLGVPEVARRAREAGALLALDVTQSIGADGPLPADLACDVVVGAGYKWLLGPYGTGFVRFSPKLQGQLEPLEPTWKNFAGADDFNALNEYRPEFMSPAAAFDHGQSSAFVRLAGFEAGLECLLEIGTGEIEAHCLAFASKLREGLDGAHFEMSPIASASQAAHIFRVAPRDASRFAPLSEALAAAGVSVSQRNGGWRLSPHVYNDASDVERILSVLN